MSYIYNLAINIALICFNIGACFYQGIEWISLPFACTIVIMTLLVWWQTHNINKLCQLVGPSVEMFGRKVGTTIVRGAENPDDTVPIMVISGTRCNGDKSYIATNGKKAWTIRQEYGDDDKFSVAMAIGYMPKSLKKTMAEACKEAC